MSKALTQQIVELFLGNPKLINLSDFTSITDGAAKSLAFEIIL